jgi:hemerythrin-like domain-containing protein
MNETATQLLRDDHRTFRELFARFDEAPDFIAQRDIAEEAFAMLRVHAAIEEELFYPEIETLGIEHLKISEGVQEHHVIEILMDELQREVPGSQEDYVAKFIVLRENVEHHIGEEEEGMFQDAERSGLDLVGLGRRMAERRAELERAASRTGR